MKTCGDKNNNLACELPAGHAGDHYNHKASWSNRYEASAAMSVGLVRLEWARREINEVEIPSVRRALETLAAVLEIALTGCVDLAAVESLQNSLTENVSCFSCPACYESTIRHLDEVVCLPCRRAWHRTGSSRALSAEEIKELR